MSKTMAEVIDEIMKSDVVEQKRICVISKSTFGEYGIRDIQENNSWSKNPYGDDYAIVPEIMIDDIMETKGFCDIELNSDGTEIV